MTEHRLSLTTLAAQLADGGHSIFSPSASAMWTACSGSLVPNLLAPDDVGIDAATGTVAHGIGELWLKTGKKPRHLLGTTEIVIEGDRQYEIEIDAEMLDYVQEYFDWCHLLPGEHLVEQRVYFSHLTPIEKQGGTADHMALLPSKLTITDLKYGIGEQVFAEGNTQALLYAIGAFHEHDWFYNFQEIEIRICQPRLDHKDSWTITREQLLAYEPWFKERAQAAWQIGAPRAASVKGCRWCRVKNDCAAHAVLQAELMEGVFEDLTKDVTPEKVQELRDRLEAGHFVDALNPMRLTNTEIGVLLGYRSFVESWWTSVAEEANRRKSEGQDIPGWKLVHGRSSKRFVRESVAAPRLVTLGCDPSAVYVTDVVSPAQAEKLLRKAGHRSRDIPELMQDLVVKSPGKPTLAPESDPRSAIEDVTKFAFGDLTDDNPETEKEDF